MSSTTGPKPPPSTTLPQQQQQQQQQITQRGPTGGLRTPSNRKTIYDRNLNRSRTAELSRASFAYLFGEMVSYAQKRVTGIQDLERRLNEQGHPLGLRLLDLLLYRLPPTTTTTTVHPTPRPLHILPLLQFISQTLWRHLFSRPADTLEKSSTNEAEYMVSDNEPLVNTYISVPKEMNQLNCAAFVAGVVEGVCDGCGFPARVSAHNVGGEMWPGKTVFLIRFEDGVVEREGVLERAGR
ncbi:MAG: TRAPP subunit trs31 [Pleopsidium flavum]|nr:MAG: TRAPP subunit trs31 [Pleopsidium flavum]KAI9876124.1 MAG: TRAPP subunit trs31 [Pleopsidium flavum]